MDDAIVQAVRMRAGDACEYCHMPRAFYRYNFVVDHIIARQHGGDSGLENLAWCCLSCNRYKGPNIATLDPSTGGMTPLFHPRRDRWSDHFEWNGPILIARSQIGRATASLLRINNTRHVAVRRALITEGVFPSSR